MLEKPLKPTSLKFLLNKVIMSYSTVSTLLELSLGTGTSALVEPGLCLITWEFLSAKREPLERKRDLNSGSFLWVKRKSGCTTGSCSV